MYANCGHVSAVSESVERFRHLYDRRAGEQPVTREEFADYWQRALDDPDRIWPEDVLTDEEWNRGWFDRQVIAGKLRPEDAATVTVEFGGTKP